MKSSGWTRVAIAFAFAVLGLGSAALAVNVNVRADVDSRQQQLDSDYVSLLEETEDKDALEAIRALHMHLDDDEDGAIEPSETGNFIAEDLLIHEDSRGIDRESSTNVRSSRLHLTDSEISVRDLWQEWRRSEVYSWTVEQVIDWLVQNVELPQYAEKFRTAQIKGTQMPRLTAATAQFFFKTLGIYNPIHRSKVSLKAMDLVLFGPPREGSSVVKDIILSSLLVMAVMGLFYVYTLNRKHQEHLQRMMSDMDSLAKAEQALRELQDKFQLKDNTDMLPSSSSELLLDSVEVSRLRQELEVLRAELHRAEIELEDRCWMASPVLQHWLRLTYETESLTYNAKKRAAEEQLAQAKEMCERMRRKRSSLVSAFVSTHGGRSIDEVDRSILEAKTALLEVTRDLTERTQRWRQIELLCGLTIASNLGTNDQGSLGHHVGSGSCQAHLVRANGGMSSRMSRSGSHDDLLQDDVELVSNASFRGPMNFPPQRRAAGSGASSVIYSNCSNRVMCREASKDSSTSLDDQSHSSHVNDDGIQMSFPASPALPDRHLQQLLAARASTPPVPNPSLAAKRARMVKSYSQDAAGSIQKLAGSMRIGCSAGSIASIKSAMTASLSEGQLQKEVLPLNRTASIESNGSSLNLSKTSSAVEELSESCSASESGSANDLDARKKKKLPFFTFKRKKEKSEI